MPKIIFPQNPSHFLDYSLTSPRGKNSHDTLVIYVHGFASHQNGEKVLFFKDQFTEVGMAFLAFDHRGHGNSSGTMKELTVTKNLEDLHQITGVEDAVQIRVTVVGGDLPDR